MKHIRFDWAIKKILRDKVNFVILEGFLTELIGDVITLLNHVLRPASVRRPHNTTSEQI